MKRALRNICTTGLTLRRWFPKSVLDAIEVRIKNSEAQHGGQVCFAVETSLHLNHIVHGFSSRQRAIDVFARLRIWDTEHNNGVLLYVLLSERRIEIIADRGIERVVPQHTWDAICGAVQEHFKRGRFQQGVEEAIEAITGLIKQHFPHSSSGSNELSDRPVVL